MKKILSLVTAGALLLSVAGVVLAKGSSINQFSFTTSKITATSTSGQNLQMGSGKNVMFTGNSNSAAVGVTAGNVVVGDPHSVNQTAMTTSTTSATSVSGKNTQFSGGFMGTGNSGSLAGNVTVSNVIVSLE